MAAAKPLVPPPKKQKSALGKSDKGKPDLDSLKQEIDMVHALRPQSFASFSLLRLAGRAPADACCAGRALASRLREGCALLRSIACTLTVASRHSAGLSSTEHAKRLADWGPNALSPPKETPKIIKWLLQMVPPAATLRARLQLIRVLFCNCN